VVSVVLPAHRAEDWLPACLDSLVAQTEPDWEAVVVIDGSPDAGEAIARDHARRDDRIRVIVAPHGGPGAARNIGVASASGEYLAFVDADDLLVPRALELLLSAARADDADIVVGAGDDLHEDGRRIRYWTQADALHRSRRAGLTAAGSPRLLLDHVPWAKLYRRSWFDEQGLRFPEGVHAEDVVIWVQAALRARRISVVPEVVYLHRRHGGAISADHLRARTLRDWIGESTRALRLVEAEAGPEGLRVYLSEFLARQWRTRGIEYDRLPDAESARLLGEQARELVAMARRSGVELPPAVGGLLAAVAGGWAEEPPRSAQGESLNPVTSALPKDGAGLAVRAERLRELHRGGRVDSGWARAVFVDQLLVPLARLNAAQAEVAHGQLARTLRELYPGPRRLRLIPGRRAKLGVLLTGRWRAEPLARLAVAARRPTEPRARAFYSGRPVRFYPAWETVNPFLTMLHLEARGRMRAVEGLDGHYRLLQWLRAESEPAFLHLHWTGPIVDRAESDEQAERIVDEFLDALDRRLSTGSELIWTVHNVLPHDNAHPAAGRRLHQALADRARVVHVLTEGTVAAIGDEYALPAERIRYIPHASYRGVYGEPLPAAEARSRLGVAEGATAVLFFGQLRPYKGLDLLGDAVLERHRSGQRLHLLLAGRPRQDGAVDELIARLREAGVPVTAEPRFIGEDEVATWFSAADVVALPYTRILNSGTALLAAGYGVPVVVTRSPGIDAEYGDQRWVRIVDGERIEGGLSAALADEWYLAPESREAARSFAAGRSLLGMSRAYADLLDELDPPS